MAETGKISWFGGPSDPGAQGTPASGHPITQPGIAVYNQATLGGWWLLRMPNGRLGFVQQTDIGPAPSTGRKFDFTYSALPGLGYTTANFPTNASVSGVYLGKTKTDVQRSILQAAQDLGANTPNISGWINVVTRAMTFGVTPASGNMVGPIALGAADKSNQPLQPSGPPNVVKAPLAGIDAIAAFISSGSNWLRLGEVLLGGLLLLLGLRALTGGDGNPVSVVKKVARAR